MIVKTLKSLLILGAVGASFAYVVSSFGGSFWIAFLFGVIIQFVAWSAFMRWIVRRNEIRHKELENEMLAELAKQSVPLPCAYCGGSNLVPIRFDENNSFECDRCNEESVIYLNVNTVQKTVPIDLNDPRIIINESTE